MLIEGQSPEIKLRGIGLQNGWTRVETLHSITLKQCFANRMLSMTGKLCA
jgi:hypothetical protein